MSEQSFQSKINYPTPTIFSTNQQKPALAASFALKLEKETSDQKFYSTAAN